MGVRLPNVRAPTVHALHSSAIERSGFEAPPILVPCRGPALLVTNKHREPVGRPNTGSPRFLISRHSTHAHSFTFFISFIYSLIETNIAASLLAYSSASRGKQRALLELKVIQ